LGLADDVLAAPPPDGVATRIVAIDGCGGAGKSTLAARLSRELGGVEVVHTDDFATAENPVDWWPEVVERVLEPLARGEPGRTVILEGVTASRDAFRPYLAYTIWVDAPRELRLRRGLERDGESMREQWEQWMAAEDAYVERERPHERADAVVRGV
jgi:uridine kinase